MRFLGFLAAFLLAATAIAQLPQGQGEIIVTSQRVAYSLTLDIDVIRWEFQTQPPDGVTIAATGVRSAAAETDGAAYLVIAWTSETTARLLRLGSGDAPVPPVVGPIAELRTSADTVKRGQAVTLTWTAGGTATGATLQGLPVALAGTQTVTPQATTTYLFVSQDGTRTAVAQRIVTVSDLPPPVPPVAGLWILGVRDPLAPGLTAEQVNAFDAADVRTFMAANCAKSPDGSPGFLFTSPTSDLSKMPQVWRDAQAALAKDFPAVKPPCWMVSNGKTKWAEPWPANSAAVLTRLQDAVKGMK